MDKCHKNSALGKSLVIDWFTEYKRYELRCLATKEKENIKKIVLTDRKIKVHKVAETIKI